MVDKQKFNVHSYSITSLAASLFVRCVFKELTKLYRTFLPAGYPARGRRHNCMRLSSLSTLLRLCCARKAICRQSKSIHVLIFLRVVRVTLMPPRRNFPFQASDTPDLLILLFHNVPFLLRARFPSEHDEGYFREEYEFTVPVLTKQYRGISQVKHGVQTCLRKKSEINNGAT